MDLESLAQAVDRAIEAESFSGVAAIRQGGEVLLERAAGHADRSNGLPNRPDTRFAIASGTKFLTALAIGRLVEASALDFETRLSDCVRLPFKEYSDEITIAHLLSHTAGIPDYYDEEQIADFAEFHLAVPWYRLHGPGDYLAVLPDAPMRFPPGQRFAYNNSGYILLGVVIEALSGRRYQDFVAEQVFKPAGMVRSGFFASNRLPADTAFGYIDDDTGWRTNWFNLPIVGASDGGAYTTAGDLARLWDAFWGGQILPPALVTRFASPAVPVSADGLHHYGVGLWLRETAGGSEVYVVGEDPGVSMKSSFYPSSQLQVTVLSNTSDRAWPVVRAISEALAAQA